VTAPGRALAEKESAVEMGTAAREIAVAVIEDDRATREGLRLLLSATPGFR
jgi:hypothetical protein